MVFRLLIYCVNKNPYVDSNSLANGPSTLRPAALTYRDNLAFIVKIKFFLKAHVTFLFPTLGYFLPRKSPLMDSR